MIVNSKSLNIYAGGNFMIVMRIKLDHIYSFNNFEVDFTYPKKVKNSLVREEYLSGNESFRYKKVNIFIGSNASGKTTLMNALLSVIPHDKSGLVIQESEELHEDNHPDLMFQHVVSNHGEGHIEYTLKDLTINGLLTDNDYFIIGEIKGGEAAYFLNASYTGHKCWCSVHGINSTEALNKLADYVMYETSYSRNEIMSMLKCMETIVFLEDFKIKEISEVSDYDYLSGRINYKRIY